MARAATQPRGRSAERPGQIPARGWLDVGWRVKRALADDHVSITAAGVAFFAFLAIFPGLAALVALYGVAVEPREAAAQIDALTRFLPPGAEQLVTQQLARLSRTAGSALTVGGAIAVLVATWSANRGTRALIKALNIAYDEDEGRGFLRLTALSLGLTLLGVAGMLLALVLVALLPVLVEAAGLGGPVGRVLSWGRWPVLLVLAMALLAVFYRLGPSRRPARWRWVSPGAVLATVLWLAASLLFSLYVSTIGNYDETYGSLGAVAVLMLWLYLSAFAALLGAEVNAEAERQTRLDSTLGPSRPLGQRQAYAADTVGEGRR